MTAKVLQPGETVGGNLVVRLIGAGGFAQVYEVNDRSGARRALKVLDADAEARPKLRARLAQEGSALAMIEHVNVVRLYDAGADDERIYLLLELVQGENLREAVRARGGRLPVEAVVRWLRQAAEGVAEAHRIGVIHRDLKPENLLVTPEEVVKVIDFGIAKLAGWGVKTSQEQRVGTALYMSPEQIQGKAPDPRMDVYALGLILYEALAGAHPIVAEPTTVFQICALQLGHRARPLAEAVPGLPPELCAIVDRAIEKDPELRLPSVRAFSDALQEVLLRLGEDRRAALRSLMTSPGPRGLASTQPLPSMPSVVLAPPHLVRTMPLSESLPIASTAPVLARAPRAAIAVRATPSAAPERSRAAVVVVVVAAIVLGVAGGVGLVLWVLP